LQPGYISFGEVNSDIPGNKQDGDDEREVERLCAIVTRGNPAYRSAVLGLTQAQLEPYVVVATRSMMFEETVMRYAGLEDIPTFDEPHGKTKSKYHLGHACQGEQIPNCLKFYQNFFTDFDEQKLETMVCVSKCRKK